MSNGFREGREGEREEGREWEGARQWETEIGENSF